MDSVFWDYIFPFAGVVALAWLVLSNADALRAWWQSAQAFLGV